MDENKVIKFTTLIDTSQFDEAIKKMTSSLAALQQKFGSRIDVPGITTSKVLEQTISHYRHPVYGAGSSSYGAEMTNRAIIREELENRRKIIESIKEEMRVLEDLRKNVLSLIEARKKLNAQSQEYQEISQRILEEQKKIAEKENEIVMLRRWAHRPGYGAESTWGTLLHRGMESAQAAMAGGGGLLTGAGGFLKGIGGGIYDMMRYNPAHFWGGLAFFTGTSLVAGSQIYRDFALAPGQIVEAIGAARTGQAMPYLNAMSGNVYEEIINMPLAEKAREMSATEIEKTKTADRLGSVGKTLLGAAAGIAGAAALGITTGGVGLIPLLLGGLAGTIGGAYYNRYDLLGSFGLGTYGQVYEARKQAEQSQRFLQLYQSLRQSDPYFQYTLKQYERFQLENLPIQRALGLPDDIMRDILWTGNMAGFLDENMRQAMMTIAQAGGSTSGARRHALNANLLQRNIGLLNAANIYGALSYLTGGNTGMTEEAIKEILSSAVKKGLDDSNYRQEFNKYTDTLVQYIQRVGADTPEDVRRVSESFAEMVSYAGPISKRAIDAAYNINMGIQAQTVAGGAPQVLRLAGYLQNKTLSGLGFQTLSLIDMLTPEQLNTDFARKILGEDVVREAIKVKQQQFLPFKQADEAMARLQKIDIQDFLKNQDKYTPEQREAILKDIRTVWFSMTAMDKSLGLEIFRQGDFGLSSALGILGRWPFLEKEKTPEEKGLLESVKDRVSKFFDTSSTPTGGDEIMRANAQMQNILKDNFTLFEKHLKVSAEMLELFANALRNSLNKLEAVRAQNQEIRGGMPMMIPSAPRNPTPRTK